MTWPLADASADVVIAMLILEMLKTCARLCRSRSRPEYRWQFFFCELHPIRNYRGQAHFSNTKTGERQRIVRFLHDVSDYVNAGLSSGLELEHMGEWRDADAQASSQPGFLSLTFRRDLHSKK